MNILLTPARIGPVEIPNRIVMPPMTTRARTRKATSPTRPSPITWRGCAAASASSPSRWPRRKRAGRHRRRELGIYDDRFLPGLTRLVARNPPRRRQGFDPARPRRRPHPRRHLRRDAGRAVGDPASGATRSTNETIVPRRDDRSRIAQTTAAYAAAAQRAREGGLRLRRNPRRARLSDLAVPHAVREPPHRRIRRQPGKPRPLRPRRAARGARPRCRGSRDLPAVGRRLFRRRAAPMPKASSRDLGREGRRRRAARHRRALPLPAHRAPHDPADDRAGRDVSRLRRRHQEGGRHTGDRGRPARRSRAGRARRSKAARRISSRSAARSIADPQWVEKLARDEPIRRCLACNTCVDEMRGGVAASLRGQRRAPAARRDVRKPASRRRASASR